MILPLSLIQLQQNTHRNTIFKKQNSILAPSYDFSIYDKNTISFAHFMGFQDNSDIISDPKYFKLQPIKLSDGTTYQPTPDKCQIECAKRLLKKNSVVFCAPTGTGKTAVAHFAVNKNLDNDKKTYITVPLVALANDKYREFSNLYGKNNVGVMTGDKKINPNAPIIIMTTEILFNQASQLKNRKDIGTIIFDEAHYMSDDDRGNVWENSIIASVPNGIQILCLSATVGNAEMLNDWISNLNGARKSSLVELKQEERYVPLVWQIYDPDPEAKEKFKPVIQYPVNIGNLSVDTLSDKQRRAISRIFQIFKNKNAFYEPTNSEIGCIISLLQDTGMKSKYESTEVFEEAFLDHFKNFIAFTPEQAREIANLLRDENNARVKKENIKSQAADFTALVRDLKREDKLPALIFKLSKKQCDNVAQSLFDSKLDLTNSDEKREIRTIINKYKEKSYLGQDIDEDILLKGIGVHHAGKLPQYRKLVEELFSKKLLKAVASTSTLSAGINMPARTVVLSDMSYVGYDSKNKEQTFTPISVNEFHQMAGRAGRRGIDSIGNVILYNIWNPSGRSNQSKKTKSPEELTKKTELELAYEYIDSKADGIVSKFKPDPVLICKYFYENEGSKPSSMIQLVEPSFCVYSAKNKDRKLSSKARQFADYSQILLKNGFLYKNHKDQCFLSNKGRLLSNAQGANPLMVTSIIDERILDGVKPETLAQVAGYIASSDVFQDPEGMDNAVRTMLKLKLKDSDKEIREFANIRSKYNNIEFKLIKSLNESKVPPKDINTSNSISGYLLYLWAHLNKENPNDTIGNFQALSLTNYSPKSKDIGSSLEVKLSEGNVYRVISHSISVLKQIQRICDYAIDNPSRYTNTEYYKNLKECASKALALINVKPIDTEDA